jgi:murein L,D-transpeptidase YcbB/YkuD
MSAKKLINKNKKTALRSLRLCGENSVRNTFIPLFNLESGRFMPPAIDRSPARMTATLCLLFWLFPLILSAAPEDTPQQAIAAAVRALGNDDPVTIEGEPLASRIVLPALYKANNDVPLWSNPHAIDQLLTAIRTIDREGLTPADYHLEALETLQQQLASGGDAASPGRAADFDLLLTDALVRLGYHLAFGKVDPEVLDPDWNMRRQLKQPDAVSRLDEAIHNGHIDTLLNSLRPTLPSYTRLIAALQEYRRIAAEGGWQNVPAGPSLKPGMTDMRVVALRHRLAASGDLSGDKTNSPDFDAQVEVAVRRFQGRHGLTVDGIAGKATLAAMNVPVERRIDQIRANLERARWVLHDLPAEYVLVDIAGFKVRFYRDGRAIWETRAVVGRPMRMTPIFKSRITYLEANPTWTVPPTILGEDVLPAIRRDPHYLQEKNMRVIDRQGNTVDPAGINWSRYRGSNFPYMIRQDPGPENALGRLKFMFPNKHAVYLHDTPGKELFKRTERIFSSGCIRIEDPYGFAELLLDGDPERNRERVMAAVDSRKTSIIRLRTPVVVILLYWTVDVDDDGTVLFKQDIYNRDPPIIKALGKQFSFRKAPLINATPQSAHGDIRGSRA